MKVKYLWFKAKFVAPILNGEKTDTFRKVTDNFEVGQICSFSVGPRPPFALARVITLTRVKARQIERQKRSRLFEQYGKQSEFLRVEFRVLSAAEAICIASDLQQAKTKTARTISGAGG